MIIQFGNPLNLTEYTQWIHWSLSWRSTHLWLIGWFNLMEQFVFYPQDPWKGVDMIALFHQCSRLGFSLIMSSARTKDIPWWPFVNSGPLLFTGWVSSILTLISARDTTNHSDMRRPVLAGRHSKDWEFLLCTSQYAKLLMFSRLLRLVLSFFSVESQSSLLFFGWYIYIYMFGDNIIWFFLALQSTRSVQCTDMYRPYLNTLV